MNGIRIESAHIGAKETGVSKQRHLSRSVPPLPHDLENRILRQALRENLVSFPSQVPVFGKQSRPDLQQKIVVLYFVRGWTMDDIAQRFGLGRQRMGQILTAWRLRAVKEGYLQAIEPEHPLFQRVRMEQANQFAELPVHPNSAVERVPRTVPAPIAQDNLVRSETEEPQLAAPVTEFRASSIEEKLQAIVGVLDNQLRLCSPPINGNIDSCEQLLARAKVLCARLEEQHRSAHSNEERRITIIISAAKELFQRFQEHTVEQADSPSRPVLGQGGNSQQVRGIAFVNSSRNMPPRESQRVAAGV
jgi:hypothetical protein